MRPRVDVFALSRPSMSTAWASSTPASIFPAAAMRLLSRAARLRPHPRQLVEPHSRTIHYLDGRRVELHEPFIAGRIQLRNRPLLPIAPQRPFARGPVIPHSMSLSMARLLEAARTSLGVRFPGE